MPTLVKRFRARKCYAARVANKMHYSKFRLTFHRAKDTPTMTMRRAINYCPAIRTHLVDALSATNYTTLTRAIKVFALP